MPDAPQKTPPQGSGKGRTPRRGPQMPKMPRGDSFWFNLATSVMILFLLAGAYAYFADSGKGAVPSIPISQLAQDISAGKVTSIVVDGDTLDITYADQTEKTSKKEPDTAITTTLANYDINKDALDKVSIEIKQESSWDYWLNLLLPFIAPALLIAFFVWYLSGRCAARACRRSPSAKQAARHRPQRPELARDLPRRRRSEGGKRRTARDSGLFEKPEEIPRHWRAHPERHPPDGRAGHRQDAFGPARWRVRRVCRSSPYRAPNSSRCSSASAPRACAISF